MRTIKFRGKRVDNGEWVYGYLFKYMSYMCIATDEIEANDYGELNGRYYAEVIPETVGQFTGLTDKNGKEIYEGDLMTNPMGVYQVTFSQGCFYPFWSVFSKHCEVIGNIHDNPELLKGGKE